MATFWTDFSTDTLNQQPSGWTERWETAARSAEVKDSATSGVYPAGAGAQALQIDDQQSGSHQYILNWDSVGVVSANVDIQARVLYASSVMRDDGLYVAIRTGTNEFGYLLTLVTTGWQLIRYDLNTGDRSVLVNVPATVNPDTWYRVRLQGAGTTIRAKVWADANPEPGTWGASAVDSQITTGLVGVGKYPQGGFAWVDWIGVGTGGDNAPTEAPVTGPQTIEPEGIPSSEEFGNTQVELGGIQTVQFQVGASADDWYVLDGGLGTFAPTTVRVQLGGAITQTHPTTGGFRFSSVTVSPDETLHEGTILRITSEANSGDGPLVRLRAVDADNPAAPTSAGEHNGLALTTAFVDWQLPATTVGEEYDSPPIDTLIQELWNRPGYSAGNAVIIHFETIEPSAGPTTNAESYDGNPTLAAKLLIEYGDPPTGLNIRPEGIPSSEAFGTPTLDMGNVDIEPVGIASGEAFGTPALDMNLDITPSGIASEEAFGTIALDLNLDLTPTGIASSEAFGAMTLDVTGPQTIEPTGIPSGEAFGTITVTVLTPQTIEPSGIASAEAFGEISVEVEGFVPPPEPVTADLYTPPTYVIWLREPDTLNAVQRLAWVGTLSFTRRDYQLGPFSFSVHNDHIDTDWLLGDGLVEVLRDGEQVYVGMVDSVTLDEATGIWRVNGLDARNWFSFRDAWPASGEEHDSVSAVTAGNAIIHYVENNFSAPADADRDADGELGTNLESRAVEWTVPATSALGATVTYNARYINLLTLLFQLARGADILFWVKLAVSGVGLNLYNRYELVISEGTDRTEGQIGGMVFSVGIGTASRITYGLNRRGHRNTLLTLGQGEGVDRVAVEVEDAADVADHFRREATLDARNAATSATLSLTANPSATETVVIGTATYTFVTTLALAGDVLIGANDKASLANLAAAINGDVGEGSVYGTGTTLNADVAATTGDAGLTVQLKGLRTAGIALSETLANGSWSTASIALTALEEAGEAKVAESVAGEESWTVTPDLIRAPWRTSWDLGDTVTVRSQYLPESADKLITAVTVRYDRNSGEQISISLGDPPQTIGAKLAGKLGEINRVIVE